MIIGQGVMYIDLTFRSKSGGRLFADYFRNRGKPPFAPKPLPSGTLTLESGDALQLEGGDYLVLEG